MKISHLTRRDSLFTLLVLSETKKRLPLGSRGTPQEFRRKKNSISFSQVRMSGVAPAQIY